MKNNSKISKNEILSEVPAEVVPKALSLLDRIKAPTPRFFKTLRNIGVALAAAGGVILASPVAVPAALISVAGYIALAGGIITAVSQTAVQHDE